MSQPYFYQEITCNNDGEITIGFMMGRVMNALHMALVNAKGDNQYGRIGLGFPGYQDVESDLKGKHQVWEGPPIGNRIRVFVRRVEDLQEAKIEQTLLRFSDYIHLRKPIELKRPKFEHVIFSRHQPRSGVERQIRRQIKRQGWTREQAEQHFRGYRDAQCNLPYVDMHSQSSRHRFRLFIRRRQAESSDRWEFSTYGLSTVSAVPQF